MIKHPAPILAIEQFQHSMEEESFYARLFSHHLKFHHTTISTPHKHDFYLSVCFTHGHGTHEIDFETYPIHPGSLFFLQPGQTHHWELSDDIEGYIFFHSRAFYDAQYARKSITDFPIFQSSRYAPYLQLDPGETQKVVRTFQTLLASHPISSKLQAEKVCSILDVFYIDISEKILVIQAHTQANSGAYLKKMKELEAWVETFYKLEKLPHQYAQKMNVTAKHLNRICQMVLGKTTSQIINDRIILEAKRMLVHPDSELNETAFELGFKDYPYFSRWFKRHTGQTPSLFKQQYK